MKTKPIKWCSEYDAKESRYDYWTKIRSTPLGEIFILLTLTPKSTKSYVQEVAVWIGDGDEPVYRTKEKIPLNIARTIEEIDGLQKNVLSEVAGRLAETSQMIDSIVYEENTKRS